MIAGRDRDRARECLDICGSRSTLELTDDDLLTVPEPATASRQAGGGASRPTGGSASSEVRLATAERAHILRTSGGVQHPQACHATTICRTGYTDEHAFLEIADDGRAHRGRRAVARRCATAPGTGRGAEITRRVRRDQRESQYSPRARSRGRAPRPSSHRGLREHGMRRRVPDTGSAGFRFDRIITERLP
jgi:hypothetical protein